MIKIPLIEVSGNHYDIGYQIGRKLKRQIKRTIKIPEQVAKENNYFKIDYFIKTAQKYFPYANKYFPKYVTELKGMADGSNQDFDLLWLLNVEEVLMDDYFDKCTSIAFREVDDNIYLYHNEDFEDAFINNIAIVKAQVNHTVKFLSLTFAGMLPGSSVSINSHGLIQGINSLHTSDERIGVPKNFISRAILETKNIKEAIRIIKIKERASAYNHVLIQGKEIIDVETTAKNYKLIKIKEDIFVHTNNYLYRGFKDKHKPGRSLRRLELAQNILKNTKIIDKNTITSILKSHEKNTKICLHKGVEDMDVTLTSLIVDGQNKKLYATKGNPCKNEYQEYSLE